MNLFSCRLHSFSKEVFNKKVQSVMFNSLQEGIVMIYSGHENAEFFMAVGEIEICMKDSVKVFLNGCGYVRVEDNVEIFAFPILSALSEEVAKLGDIGEKYTLAWNRR